MMYDIVQTVSSFSLLESMHHPMLQIIWQLLSPTSRFAEFALLSPNCAGKCENQ
eukprot:m.184964 g.184964  ORF g.184964 m.184964 type:complete len:54 (+) comp32214_c1_seq1:646-807(+)